jgi:hypothetical protein
MNSNTQQNKNTASGKSEKELILQSLIESFRLENIFISEERARLILKKIELKQNK